MVWKRRALLIIAPPLAALALMVARWRRKPCRRHRLPVAVSLDPGTTALLVLDITTQTCSPQANCLEMLPRVASLLASARAAGVYVVYSTPATQPPILPEVAPADGDPIVPASARIASSTRHWTSCCAPGIQRLILVGWRENGSFCTRLSAGPCARTPSSSRTTARRRYRTTTSPLAAISC